jgi:hypothetical protein
MGNHQSATSSPSAPNSPTSTESPMSPSSPLFYTPGDKEKLLLIDHGYVYPLGLYSFPQYPAQPTDYNMDVVQSLIINRQLAPFYKGEPSETSIMIKSMASSPSKRGNSLRNTFRKALHGEDNSNNNNNNNSDGNDTKNCILYNTECPICLLYYPENINYCECCNQPICTDCFIQIKRSLDGKSLPTCPFCVRENFGIVYKGKSSLTISCDSLRPSLPAHIKKLQEKEKQRQRRAGEALARTTLNNRMEMLRETHMARGGGNGLINIIPDLEELMIAEAIRLSLQEQADNVPIGLSSNSNSNSNMNEGS